MSEPGPKSPPGGQRFLWLMLVYAALVTAVFAHQILGRGTLSKPSILLKELHASEEGPWELGEEVPYRYRPVFRWIVLGVFEALPWGDDPVSIFYGVFVTLSAFSLLGAAWACDWYLRGVGLDDRQAAVGTVLFLLGFPILFGYDHPVHTREDLLGYAAIALTLGLLARGKLRAASAAACVGVWIRETCLLGILPLAFLQPRPRQAWAYYLAPGLSFLAVRVARADPRHPMSLGELLSNSTQPLRDWPLEALLYAFAAFGALWVAAGLRLRERGEPGHPLLATRVVVVAGAAVVLTGWVLGMVRENRITYILFPWVIPLALRYLYDPRRRGTLRDRPAWACGLAVMLLGVGFLAWIAVSPSRINAVRPLLGESFNLGVGPSFDGEVDHRAVSIDLVYAPPHQPANPPQLFSSRANGPYVLWHLACAAFLLAAGRPSRETTWTPSSPPPSS